MKKSDSFQAKKILIVRYGCENYDYIFDFLKKHFINPKSKNSMESLLFKLTIEELDISMTNDKANSTKGISAKLKQELESDVYPVKRELLLKDLEERCTGYDLCIALLNISVQGNKYGACLDTEEKGKKVKEKHFYLSFKEAGSILRANSVSAINFVMVGIYRDLIRHICLGSKMMEDEGSPRCIFTRSIHDRINYIKFATLFPTISRCAEKKIKSKSSGLSAEYAQFLCKTVKEELAFYKPDLYERMLCRFKIHPVMHFIVISLLSVFIGVVGDYFFEIIKCIPRLKESIIVITGIFLITSIFVLIKRAFWCH